MKNFLSLAILFCLVFTYAVEENINGQNGVTNLSGPRLGVTLITGKSATTLEEDFDAIPIISQFGWQFEWRFYSIEGASTGIVEFVPLIGGVEQGLFLPSLSGLIGIRGPKGTEFGIGPNISITGAAIVAAVGVTKQAGQLNIPFNFAVVASKEGYRFSFLIGFNVAR